ncbi:MAG: hypothetical protein ALECFALPRED_002030 [Alectoria fallacina]|uniref:Uncharacterized protein n=1 Tax=Alectoria fallacina TaxID=1903189 RepID=A0A8H3FA03_9LECA|nr:MAG: hypothetical protein ALECFALPRED_002030 [Alectoria fallacina]
MENQMLAEATAEGTQPSMESLSLGKQRLSEANPEETPPSNIKKLVRKLTKKVKPSKKKDASPPSEEEQESAEDKLAGFMSRNPNLFVPAEEASTKQASLEIPEPVARVRALSRSQRELERLENPLILDPTPEEEVEEQKRNGETMRQSRTARFRKRLEEYF